MAFVVTEPCIKCVYTDCVEVCPTDCFRVGPNFMVIDPAECIDCGVCVAECPVDAIVLDDDLPEDQRKFIQINIELASKWPEITKTRLPLPEASRWKDVKDKLQYLEST